MPIEYEYFFTNFDKNDIIKKLTKNKGKLKGIYLFRIQVYECNDCYLRVRDEGYKVTLTHKKKKGNFDEENEIVINDFETGVQLLDAMGYKKKYYYEKIREIWKCGQCEIIFDTIPGLPDTMEVECSTKTILDDITKYLNVKKCSDEARSNLHIDLFGIDLNKKEGDNTFKNLKKVLLPLVTKNKEEFNALIRIQLAKYKALVKK